MDAHALHEPLAMELEYIVRLAKAMRAHLQFRACLLAWKYIRRALYVLKHRPTVSFLYGRSTPFPPRNVFQKRRKDVFLHINF